RDGFRRDYRAEFGDGDRLEHRRRSALRRFGVLFGCADGNQDTHISIAGFKHITGMHGLAGIADVLSCLELHLRSFGIGGARPASMCRRLAVYQEWSPTPSITRSYRVEIAVGGIADVLHGTRAALLPVDRTDHLEGGGLGLEHADHLGRNTRRRVRRTSGRVVLLDAGLAAHLDRDAAVADLPDVHRAHQDQIAGADVVAL